MDAHSNVAGGDGFIERIARGDRAAEAEFIARYAIGVRALVRRHTRPGEPQVEDLVQDVLSNVLEKLRDGALRDPARLPAYVQNAVVFATTAEYRRRKRRGENATERVDEVPATETGPEDTVASARLARAIRQLLTEMTVARDRELLRRFYLEEQSKGEVCRILGIDGSHFHRVAHRARERFRELLLRAGIDSGG
jgi:RNA polymerase sigma-70 factor (ECF subfamily)